MFSQLLFDFQPVRYKSATSGLVVRRVQYSLAADPPFIRKLRPGRVQIPTPYAANIR